MDYWADVLAKGGGIPTGLARSMPKELAKDVMARVPQISASANDIIGNKAEVAGITAGARSVGTRSANFGLAKSEAYSMADLVTKASESVPRTSFQPINKVLSSYYTNTGDPKIREFGAAINSFINAYARAVSPVGTPTVSDKDHARDMLSSADSHAQVVAIIEQLKREMEAAGNAPKVVRGEQRQAVQELGGGPGIGGTPRTAAPARQAPAAAVQYLKAHPEMREQFRAKYGYLPE